MKDLLSLINSTELAALKKSINIENKFLYDLLLQFLSANDDIDIANIKNSYRTTYEYIRNKKELEDLILNFIFSSNFHENYPKHLRLHTEINKSIIIARHAYYKNQLALSKKILKKTIKTSLQMEYYESAFDASYILLGIAGKQNKLKEFQKYTDLTNKFNDYRNAKHMINMLHANALILREKEDKQLFINYCESIFLKVKKILKELDSVKIKFIYYNLKVQYYFEKKEFNKVYKFADRKLKLFYKNKHIFNSKVLGLQTLRIAETCLYHEDYEKGLDYLHADLDIIQEIGKVPYLRALETLFLLYFNSGEFKKIPLCLIKLKKLKLTDTEDIYYQERILFYESCYLLTIGKLDDALEITQKFKVLTRDKRGWSLGVRILEILIYYKLKIYDVLEYKINNFRIFIYNQNISNDKRLKAIYKSLRILLKESVNNNVLSYEAFQPHIEELEKNTNEYYRDPKSYETIRFDKWLKSEIELSRKKD